MGLNFQDSLSKLERLSPEKLDETSRRIRGDLASAEWKMGLCLLALKRSGAFRELGFGTLTGYAEKVLNLSGRKVGALLSAADALEHLPLMSEAYRTGGICWSKVRVMHGLATPETEAQWLAFAKEHSSVEVERKVAVSPREWKRHRALEASLAGKPVVRSEGVLALLSRDEKWEVRASAQAVGCTLTEASGELTVDGVSGAAGECSVSAEVSRSTLPSTPVALSSRGENRVAGQEPDSARKLVEEGSAAPGPPASSAPPLPPQTIRLVFELTPDQYALYEQAESRVRAQEGRRLPRAEVLKKMADLVLSQGTARARARHQVLVHRVEGSMQAWYETDRGVLPVAPEVLEEAMQGGHEVLAVEASGEVSVLEAADRERREGGAQERSSTMNSPDREEGTPVEYSTDCAQPIHICETATRPEVVARDTDEAYLRGPAADDLARARSAARTPMCETPAPTKSKLVDRETGEICLRKLAANDSAEAGVSARTHICETAIRAKPDRDDPLARAEEPAGRVNGKPRKKRKSIPNPVVRLVHARAGHRCECCGKKGGRLDVHHRDPVCEGGSNDPSSLELLCRACHSKKHETDFERKAHWRTARAAADLAAKSRECLLSQDGG